MTQETPSLGPEIDPPALARFLSGASSAAEAAAVRRWIDADPARGRRVAALRAAWAAAEEPRTARGMGWDAEEMWVALRAKIDPADRSSGAHETGVGRQRRPALRVERGGRWPRTGHVLLAAAAVVVLAVGVSLARRFMVTPQALPQALTFREFATAPGNRSTVTLRDGTRLVLGPATRLLVPSDFGVHGRLIELDGEAYFSVVHDPRHPFAVRAGNAVATDIGTQFDVRAYAGDRDVRVAVVEGEVKVAAAAVRAARGARERGPASTGAYEMRAGDVATVADTLVAVVHGANVARMTVWMQGGLAFDNVPLGDVVRDLARTFDLDITVADSSLGGKLVTGTFANQPVEAILEDVTAVVGARYERSGRSVVIRRGIRKAGRPGADVKSAAVAARVRDSHE